MTRHCIILTIIVLVIASCRQKNKEVSLLKPDHLSNWFIQNEDSLYVEFNNLVQSQLHNKNYNSSWGELGFLESDSTTRMGQFTLEAKKNCDSLNVTFFYNKMTNPHTRILISTGYNKKFVTALDTILNCVPNPRHFILQKFEQPDFRSSGFNFPNLVIDNKDLRILITAEDSLHNLQIFVYSKNKNIEMTNDQKVFLARALFGEELLLKKINKVNFILADTINDNLLTLLQAFIQLKK